MIRCILKNVQSSHLIELCLRIWQSVYTQVIVRYSVDQHFQSPLRTIEESKAFGYQGQSQGLMVSKPRPQNLALRPRPMTQSLHKYNFYSYSRNLSLFVYKIALTVYFMTYKCFLAVTFYIGNTILVDKPGHIYVFNQWNKVPVNLLALLRRRSEHALKNDLIRPSLTDTAISQHRL